ncbi:YesK-like family protein [Bacillus infantis]|uniref:YesK-like family protein n=1 Tax=Bacillus infantis TaxID=324767 RepID=UPI001CD4E0DA|nr:YesK-like family protein [Bacillus infantis]MCA1040028.1 YesK-like family protein [Bacillus infantis]
MAGFRVFIFISLGISTLLAVASIVLKNSKMKDKYLRGGFSALIIISIAIVIISLFIGGWSGMGYGFIGICMFIGTILNGFIYWLINSIRNRDKKPYM